MANNHSITIQNRTGSNKHYTIVAEKPKVSNINESQVWSNAFSTAIVPNFATAKVRISNQYQAVVATHSGQPGDGVEVSVAENRMVELGRRAADGTVIHGTILTVGVTDGSLQFLDDVRTGSDVNSFAVETTTGWTHDEAVKNNWAVGVGSADNHPIATFTPEPGMFYSIEPSLKFWVAPIDCAKGTIVELKNLYNKVQVDFAKSAGRFTIVHSEDGTLDVRNDD